MANLILCFHRQDDAIAGQLSKALAAHGHRIVLDAHPVEEELWDGGWASLSPSADAVIVLLSDSFCAYVNEASGNAHHNSVQNRVAQHDPSAAILPLVTEKADYPDLFVGTTALLVPSEKPEFVAQKVHEHSLHLLGQMHRGFMGRIKYASVGLLASSMLLFVLMNLDRLFFWQNITAPLFMMALGALAATSHLLFNVTGLLLEDSFHIGKVEENYLRIVLGAIMGWVSYMILSNTAYQTKDDFVAIAMVTAFLAGFSSKLVMAVINLAIGAVERGLGIAGGSQPPVERGAGT